MSLLAAVTVVEGVESGATFDISALTALAAPDAINDYAAVYDGSASAARKMLLKYLFPEYNCNRVAVSHCHYWQITDALRDINSVASGGSTAATAPWDQSAAGVVRCSTSTGTTNRAGFQSSGSALRFGGGAWHFEARIRTGADLSDGTTDYFLYAGFLDNWGAEPTDGVYWRYNDGNSSGQWELVQMNNNTPIVTASGVTVAINTVYKLTIDVVADGSSCSGTINGTTVTPSSFGVPTGSGRDCGICPINIRKTAGGSDRAVDIDYHTVTFESTTEI